MLMIITILLILLTVKALPSLNVSSVTATRICIFVSVFTSIVLCIVSLFKADINLYGGLVTSTSYIVDVLSAVGLVFVLLLKVASSAPGVWFKDVFTKIIHLFRNPSVGIGFFFISPTETWSFQPTLVGYLIYAVFFIILFYLAYQYIYNRVRFIEQGSYIFGHLKSGFLGYGLPKWWVTFSSSLLGIFIRIVGSISFVVTR